MMNRISRGVHAPPKLVWIPALVFTSVLLAFFILSFFLIPDLTDDRRDTSRLLFSMLAGFSALFMGGSILIGIDWPKIKGGKLAITATGGAAAFVFTYLYSPYWHDKSLPPGNPILVAYSELQNTFVEYQNDFADDNPGRALTIVQDSHEAMRSAEDLAEDDLDYNEEAFLWYVRANATALVAVAEDLVARNSDLFGERSAIAAENRLQFSEQTVTYCKRATNLIEGSSNKDFFAEFDALQTLAYVEIISLSMLAQFAGENGGPSADYLPQALNAYHAFENRYPEDLETSGLRDELHVKRLRALEPRESGGS